MLYRRFILALALPSVWLVPPAPAAEKAKAAAKVTYDEHVMPLLREKCFACHNQDRKSGGLRLNTFSNAMAGGASGAVVKAGDAANSVLFKLVTHQQEPHMPPKSPMLPKESLDLIRQWIEGGAPENAGSKAVVVNKPKFDISLAAAAKGKPEGPPPMPQKLSLEPVTPTARANALTALASSPWAPVIAVGGQKQVVLYHSQTLELLGVLPFPEGVPYVLKFSRNGSLLLAGGGRGGKSGRVVVWSVTTGERIFAVGDEYDCVLAADISADQTQIALGGPSKVIRVYSTRDGKLLYEIKKHTDWIYALEFSPDGVLLASGDRNGGLFVWEANTGREYFTLRGHAAAVTDVSWRADSNVLASASEDTTVRLWEMENGAQIKNWGAHTGGVAAVKYARDGRLVSCGRDRLARVWDQNGAQQRAFEALPDLALRVAFNHDASRVICGDWSGKIRAWSTADGKAVGDLLANPPTLAERLEAAKKDLATRKAAHDQLAIVAAASQATAQKAAADLAAAQKAITESATALQTANAALAKAKEAVSNAAAGLKGAQSRAAAKEVLAKALTEAAARVKDAADKAKDNKELVEATAKSQQIAAQAAGELTAAQNAVVDVTAAAKTVGDQLASAQKAADKATADAAAASKRGAALAPAAKAAADKAAADQAALAQAAGALATAQAVVDKSSAALAVVKPTTKVPAP
jgi:WD40 repeat protein